MTIPTVVDLLRPLLKFAEDGIEHSLKEAMKHLSQQYALTEHELTERQPSGKQTKFEKNVAWAKYNLNKAGLITTTSRGRFKITANGVDALRSKSEKLNMSTIREFISRA